MHARTFSLLTSLCVAGLGVVAACDPGDDPAAGTDASTILPNDGRCPTIYEDRDGDRHGNPLVSMESCTLVTGYVANDDDCDDNPATGASINPLALEVCDGLNNDCNAATTEISVCPAGCKVELNTDTSRRYLFCGGGAIAAWTSARAICTTNGFKLARIDNDLENAFVYGRAVAIFGSVVQWWLGGTDNDIDAREGEWEWNADNERFWDGAANGSAQNSAYTNWYPTQPDNGGNDPGMVRPDDCLSQVGSSHPYPKQWNDEICSSALPFVCERY